MSQEFFENYQYNSCVSRGICSLNPRNSALQTVLVLYLRLFSKYSPELDLDDEIKEFILNTISITVYNPELNEESFLFAIKKFREVLSRIMAEFSKKNPKIKMEETEKNAKELFKETIDVISAIKYGEKIYKKAIEKIPSTVRDFYSIMLVISKSLSINLLDLESFNKDYEEAFTMILKLLGKIDLEIKDIEILKKEIYNASKIDVKLMQLLRNAQEERYGKQDKADVSYSTVPNKAVLVVGSNIRELENILESLSNENIDIYTHDDMMLAHTFPKFSEYKNLKGQFGQGLENCLLDFATFPGPIILTKHSLHNIENFYRGRLFTTDYTSSPKGIIKIENNNFSQVIEASKQAKGFKTGKTCETVTIGYNFDEIELLIQNKLQNKKYEHIFIIGPDSYSLEQKTYFEKLIKLTANNVLIISFSYEIERENIIFLNTCFDNYSWFKIFERMKEFNLPITVFIPKCDRSSISQMVHISKNENVKIYLGKCTPIILNPSLINTLIKTFSINEISNAKKDLEKFF